MLYLVVTYDLPFWLLNQGQRKTVKWKESSSIAVLEIYIGILRVVAVREQVILGAYSKSVRQHHHLLGQASHKRYSLSQSVLKGNKQISTSLSCNGDRATGTGWTGEHSTSSTLQAILLYAPHLPQLDRSVLSHTVSESAAPCQCQILFLLILAHWFYTHKQRR